MSTSALLKNKPSYLAFKKIELQDRAEIDAVLTRHPRRISGFTFPALYVWSGAYDYEWAKFGDAILLISCRFPGETQRHYLQPTGDFDADCQGAFLEMVGAAEYPVKLFGVGDIFLKKYPRFCAHFLVENDPGLANYIYRADDLAQLVGKIYAKKRNLIAQGSAQYEWKAFPLTALHVPDCMDILTKAEVTHDGEDRWLHEKEAARAAIRHFVDLGQKGVLITVDGTPAAFSIYEPMSPDTAVVHFEKADRHYKGLYQIINQETAKAIAGDGYNFINREEDMGIEGLRQAKHSYAPCDLVPSYTLTTA